MLIVSKTQGVEGQRDVEESQGMCVDSLLGRMTGTREPYAAEMAEHH